MSSVTPRTPRLPLTRRAWEQVGICFYRENPAWPGERAVTPEEGVGPEPMKSLIRTAFNNLRWAAWKKKPQTATTIDFGTARRNCPDTFLISPAKYGFCVDVHQVNR